MRPILSWNLLIIAAIVISTVTSQFQPTEVQPTSEPDAPREPIGEPVVAPTMADISPGMPSPVPTASPTPTVTTRPNTYSVQVGDTLGKTPIPAGADLDPLTATNSVVLSPSLVLPQAPGAMPTVASTGAPTTASTPTPAMSSAVPITQVLGYSTLEWPIQAFEFGEGPIRLALIGGIHGGYEWNTVLLAYETIDYFAAHPEQIPESVRLYIVPAANPDGQARLLNHAGRFTPDELPTDAFPGRFNGNNVDLNRNWDSNWSPAGTWRDQEVDAGSAPFSEVETQILRDFLTNPGMDAVIFWHSARPGVYVASCEDPFPPSENLAAVYAEASAYPLFEDFYDYSVTGNATDWLACASIPAIAVELTNHTDTDWSQNLAAVQAVIDHLQSTPQP